MSVFRKNMITNDWVIFAPNRAERPIELKGHEHETDNIKILSERPQYKEHCPFCRGNESTENNEILRIDNNEGWKVRIIENKYSSVDRHADLSKKKHSLRKEINGFGVHDVIIDNPRHNTTIALMEQKEIVDLIDAYQQRYKQLQKNEKIRHIVVFKNQGIKAGGSLEHPHSQIYGLPVIPFETNNRLREAERYHDLNDNCLLCDILKDELIEMKRIIYENDSFICLMPYADLSPYHFWIVPKKHSPSFSLISGAIIESLADCMKTAFGKMFFLLRNPDFNFVIQSLAHFERESYYFHWYLSVIPQIKRKGGLEYAGGLYVNPVMPEKAAEEMRNVAHCRDA